jgi:hypothetical protein
MAVSGFDVCSLLVNEMEDFHVLLDICTFSLEKYLFKVIILVGLSSLCVLWIKPKTLCKLGKCSTTERYFHPPQPHIIYEKSFSGKIHKA